MFRNNILIAYRSLLRRRFFTLINTTGLAMGLVAAMFIYQFVLHERSYDKFNEKSDRIYRITTEFHSAIGGNTGSDAMNAAPVGPALQAEMPEVESYVRISPEYGRTVMQYQDRQFEEVKLYYADSTFFQVFDYQVLQGDPLTALAKPLSLVLTQSIAEHYFGKKDDWEKSPIGSTIKVNNRADVTVTAILADVPENSHIKFNGLVSFSTFPLFQGDPSNQWEWNDFYTYVLLHDKEQFPVFESKLMDFVDRHINNEGSEAYKTIYNAQSLEAIHLHSQLGYEAEPNGDYRTVNFLVLMAFLILLIAWANYINLSTARSEERTAEVGIRKVIGAERKDLISQFLTETFLTNLLAIIIAITCIYLFQPIMNNLAGKDLTPPRPIFLFLIAMAVWGFGSLISGLYPALVLAGLSPAWSLKGKGNKSGQDLLRKILVLFQYGSSVALVILTLIIFRQLHYMQSSDLGFSPAQKLVVHAPSVYPDSILAGRFSAFKQQLLQSPNIESISASSAVPGKYYYDLDSRGGIRLVGADESTGASFTSYRVDQDYYKTYGLEILAGEPFSRETTLRGKSLAVNESALPLLGIQNPEDAIGKMVKFQNRGDLEIKNVFKDYNHKSLRHPLEPMMLWNFIPDPLYFTLKFNTAGAADTKALLATIQRTWGTVFPENPFTYVFFDEQYNAQYEADLRLGKIIASFAILAILIACLGLFGLTSYMITLRTKEIGIRKVLGATSRNIVVLLSRKFLVLVIIAILLSIPLGQYLGNRWLDNFANSVGIQWWIFVVAGLLVLVISIATVSIQSYWASLQNPVDSISTE